MAETSFTFRVDDALKAQFTEAAKADDRPASLLLRDFMRDYVRRSRERVEHDAWFRSAVERGLSEANDPTVETIAHDRVVNETRAIIDRHAAARKHRAG